MVVMLYVSAILNGRHALCFSTQANFVGDQQFAQYLLASSLYVRCLVHRSLQMPSSSATPSTPETPSPQISPRCYPTPAFLQGKVCYTIHLSQSMTGQTKTVVYKFEDGQDDVSLGNLKNQAKGFYGDNWVADNVVFVVGDVAVVQGRNQEDVYTDYDSLRKFCFENSMEPGDSILYVSVVLSHGPAGPSV